MSTTDFIAVQCFQCSTMQVRQQRKSSNKWRCVVCNEKQSVRKVFAKGPMAKDIRLFVQSFNMSRKSADGQDPLPNTACLANPLSPMPSHMEDDRPRKSRRTDWSEYLELDAEEDCHKENIAPQQEDEGDELGPKIVTEFPKSMFKRPKLKDHASGSGGRNVGGGSSLYKPVFAKKKRADQVVLPNDIEARRQQPTDAIRPSKWIGYMTTDEQEPGISSPSAAVKAAKWKDCITPDSRDSKSRSSVNFADLMDQVSNDVWQTQFDDQKVEDDIHPDFI